MTRVRRINVSQIEGSSANNTTDDEIRPFGEAAIYIDNNGPTDKPVLSIHDGVRTHIKSKVVGPGVLYGSNADAGDDSGADTIKLIPDATLFDQGSDQYIVVDPTGGEPGHIHLRAGGTQDASTADLYLGGELTNVRVSDTSDNVRIRTTNVGDPNITFDWTFETDGNLYFPGIGNTRIGESEPGLVVSSDASVVLQSNNNGESKELFFDTNGSLVFPSNSGSIKPQVSDGVGLQIEADLDFEIKVTDGEDGASIWSFAGSEITFPDETTQTTAFTGTGDITFNGDIISGTQGSLTFGDAQNTVAVVTDAIPIKLQINDELGEADRVWLFGTGGVLTLPGEGIIRSNDDTIVLKSYDTQFNSSKGIRIGTNGYVYFELGDDPAYFQIEEAEGDAQLVARTNLTIMANGGSIIKQWTFNTDGGVTFPDSTVQATAWAGGRVVAVPTTSLGTTGDLEGDLAFNATYMYYCTADFIASGTVYNSTLSQNVSSSTVFYILKSSIPGVTPQVGWTLTFGGSTNNIANVNQNSTEWILTWDGGNSTGASGAPIVITTTALNIWKRIAWSGDTW